MNKDKLKDHSIDALVLLGLANQIRSYKMMLAWGKKKGTDEKGAWFGWARGTGTNKSKGWWTRAMSTDPQVKMATTDFHFSEVEDTESTNRMWELTRLWYWQYRLLRWVRGGTIQTAMLFLLGADQVRAARRLASVSQYLSEGAAACCSLSATNLIHIVLIAFPCPDVWPATADTFFGGRVRREQLSVWLATPAPRVLFVF